MRASADALRRLVSAMVRAGGSADGEAALVAEHLVAANLAGHDSHGVGMMPSYVRHLKAGLLVPNTKAKVVKDDGPALMFDGGRGYGRSVAGESIAAGIARAVIAMRVPNWEIAAGGSCCLATMRWSAASCAGTVAGRSTPQAMASLRASRIPGTPSDALPPSLKRYRNSASTFGLGFTSGKQRS